ncbi:hypothetical protein HN748_04745 [Candidatus Peregrinibacteria bacterium]|jgi:hypothetical protein|nr:hypothetical protein [Candidatus Peregrinibacteria bacterium]MBT7484081.1 hypothetical protein [Candidatus Peregrinibacteria bacterium]MBT7703518.1 hypothetical protein [Candidatus Peregrinibacteria bacterium]
MLTATDLFFVILAVAVALLSIFFSITLVYAILILRDINKATDAMRDSAERIHGMIIKPIKMTHEILKYAKPVVEVVEDRLRQHQEESPKPKKTTKKKSTKKKKS